MGLLPANTTQRFRNVSVPPATSPDFFQERSRTPQKIARLPADGHQHSVLLILSSSILKSKLHKVSRQWFGTG